MSTELAPRRIRERPEEPGSEIVLTEGVSAPVSASPSFENTQVFFSALSFPIDGKNPPKPFGIQSEREARDWEILGRHLGTDAVLEEIRKGANSDYRITRERTRQIVEELVEQSYDAAPEALKEAFPRESLDTKKPWSLHKSMRKSEAIGGKMREVIKYTLEGKSPQEIQEETGASRAMLGRYRGKGIPVPYLRETSGKEYQENRSFLADGLLDDRQILAIFEDIEKHNGYGVCRSLRKAGILVSLGKAARSEGVFIHKSESAAYRLLKGLGIPVLRVEYPFTDKNGECKTRSYVFVLNNHERTKEVFPHPSFDAFRTNPVEVLGRASSEIPTTSIVHDPAYISVGELLKERGIPIRPEDARKYLGPDCPASVFYLPRKDRIGGILLAARQDQDVLSGYLSAKLAS